MKRTLVVLLVLGLVPLVASAATISYSVQYDLTYDSDAFGSVVATCDADMLFNSGLSPAGYNANWVHKMDIYVSVTGLAAGEDIKQAGHKVTLSPGLTTTTTIPSPWVANNPTYSYPNPVPPYIGTVTANIFTDNSDAGPSNTDLAGLFYQISNHSANYNQIGEAAPYLLGSVYVKWTGLVESPIISAGDPETLGYNWIKWLNNQNGNTTDVLELPSSNSSGDQKVFGAPEPATLALLALGAIGIISRRRRA